MTLFLVEVRRAFARRLTLLLGILGVVAIALGGFSTFMHARDNGFELSTLREIWEGTTVALSLLGLILGASFIGAEWRANTVGLVLTWEPRRARVALAKLGGALVVTMTGYVALQALIGLAMMPAAVLHGSSNGLDAAWWRSAIGVVLRGACNVAVWTAFGFSISMLARNGAAAIGVMFAYSGVLEGALGGRFTWMRSYLLIPNAARFVHGREPEFPTPYQHSTVGAGFVLLAYALAIIAVSTAIFRSRDVT